MRTLAPFLDLSPPALVWLVHATIGGSLLILGLLVIRWLFGKQLPATIPYAAGGIILLRLALPWTPQSGLSIYANDTAGSRPMIESPAGEERWPDAPREIEDLRGIAAVRPVTVANPLQVIDEPSITRNASPFQFPPLPVIVFHIWISGIVLCLLVGTARYLRLRRWLRCQEACRDQAVLGLVGDCGALLNLSEIPPVRVVDRLRSAAILGILKPEILLPRSLLETLSPAELRHVLLHEMAHIRRRDPIAGIAAHLVLSLHWFNPLVWITVRLFAADREVLCDAAVLRSLERHEYRPYGETLLHVLRLAPPPHPKGAALLPFLSNKPEIKRRLTMIAKPKTTRSLPGLLATTATLACLALTLAAAPAQDRERETERVRSETRERDGDREKTEVRERDGDREKTEVRERDGDREKTEVRERDGDREKAEVRERDGDRPKAEPRDEDRAALNRAREQEIRAVREEIGRLAREGKHDQAEQLEKRLRLKLETIRAEGRVTDLRPNPEVRPANPPQLERHIVELTEIVRDMQRSMREMREEIRQLREERKSGE